jgi:hypothetical protein
MTRLDLQVRINALREELENRHQFGIIKMASEDGDPIPTLTLQNELFHLLYKLSKLD